jgi:hypothetical protein
MSNDFEIEDRRKFLISCGRFAAVTPPAMTLLLSTSLTSTAIARSGFHGNDSAPGRSIFDNDRDPPKEMQHSREEQSSQGDGNHASLGTGGGGGGGGGAGGASAANGSRGGGSGGSRGGAGSASRFGGGEDDKLRKGNGP